MYDYGDLVYLDVQKSASTFTGQFLAECCRKPLLKKDKHARITSAEYSPDKFYFITVRHPEAMYKSLYRFGLDGNGAVFARFRKFKLDWMYGNSNASYNRWLRFVLTHWSAIVFQENFRQTGRKFDIGFLTHRYLMLSLVDPVKTLDAMQPGRGAKEGIKAAQIFDYAIKQEALNDGLRHLAFDLKPDLFDQDKADAFLSQPRKINAAKSASTVDFRANDKVRRILERKEALLLEHYGAAKGA